MHTFMAVCFLSTGSPFQFTVGPIAGGGSHKVHAAGPGLERGEVQQPCKSLCLSLVNCLLFVRSLSVWIVKLISVSQRELLTIPACPSLVCSF